LVSTQLKVEIADLAVDCELTEYGFDSISFTQFANALNDLFQLAIAPTLFFEHPTLGALAQYFGRHHGEAFASALGVAPRVVLEAPVEARPPRRAAPLPTQATHPGGRAPIAIIGMSGVFPGAPDSDALWRNLLDGRDCITDVPAGRWDRAPRGAAA